MQRFLPSSRLPSPASLTQADYQRCILSSQTHGGLGADAPQCDPYRIALAQCSEQAVPLISATKRRCSAPIKAYNACLQRNLPSSGGKGAREDRDEEVGERLQKECAGSLRDLWRCTEMVKAELRREAAPPGKVSAPDLAGSPPSDVEKQAEHVLGKRSASLDAGGSAASAR